MSVIKAITIGIVSTLTLASLGVKPFTDVWWVGTLVICFSLSFFAAWIGWKTK